MSIGTKSLLFGLHQAIIHPLLMLAAYVMLYKKLPSLMETIAIAVHDWGYWGKKGIHKDGGENHPYLGAQICRTLFGEEGWRFCIGHNDETAAAHNVPRSRLYAVDKYYYVILPISLLKTLGELSGEHLEIMADPNRSWDPQEYHNNMITRFTTGDISL